MRGAAGLKTRVAVAITAAVVAGSAMTTPAAISDPVTIANAGTPHAMAKTLDMPASMIDTISSLRNDATICSSLPQSL